MNFDRVARHYFWLEKLVFAQRLQQARTAFLGEILAPERVLIVGEGNGRFLAELLLRFPQAEVDCIDASAQMIDRARFRAGERAVRFLHADVRDVSLGENRYDLVVTHFFLDCFCGETLASIVNQLAASAAPRAQWLIADFCQPPRGWNRVRARVLIAAMYLFFRLTAGIETGELCDYTHLLAAEQFQLASERISPGQTIRSQLWSRTTPARQ